jgi:hypothetical protein
VGLSKFKKLIDLAEEDLIICLSPPMWDSWFQPLDDQCQSQFLTTPNYPSTKAFMKHLQEEESDDYTSLLTS